MYFQQNPVSIADGLSEDSFYCILFRIMVIFYYLKVDLLTENF